MVNELYHHGILGQKWGVRRFQNKDGTLTDAGIKRYREIVDGYKKSSVYQTLNNYDRLKLSRSGIVKGDDDVIKNGSKINRWADAGEPLDHTRKYASLTDDDKFTYSEMAIEGMLNVKDRLNTKLYVYEANKDLKVASEKTLSIMCLKNMAINDFEIFTIITTIWCYLMKYLVIKNILQICQKKIHK